MNLSRKWLTDYVDVTEVSNKDYCDRMTDTGSKVEGFEVLASDIDNVVVGKITKITKHENSDHLQICMLDVGEENEIQIVTGAGNVFEGAVVPVAKAPAKLPGDIVIKAGKLRGVESNGMLCSIAELGLTTHDMPMAIENGIFILNELDEAVNFTLGMDIKEALIKDVQAIYEGDPAARSPEEIILSYPGFYAISIYRIAHEFYSLGIPCISRVMTEFAHEKTGIDIHAGATIGEYFFIDHGTGIVIGETTTIGNNVKIYQGVTLGAKSFELDADGNPIKGIKRHPDIGNNCVIYANATILGGNTRIGDGCVIGGNVWLTHSVDAGQVIYYNKG